MVSSIEQAVARLQQLPLQARQHALEPAWRTPQRPGVRWQRPVGDHAAHSLCTGIVFLTDDRAAAEWHRGELDRHSVFSLEEAVALGAATFRPLVQP